MNLDSNSCKETREKLLEFVLARQAWNDSPSVTEAHLAECQSCRRYWEGLQLVPGLFSATGLYSARLRERTLRRLLQPETTRPGYSPILVGVSLVGFCLHFLLPAWILTRLVEPLLASSILAWAAALMTVVSFGAISSLACAAALFRKQMGCSTSGILEIPQ